MKKMKEFPWKKAVRNELGNLEHGWQAQTDQGQYQLERETPISQLEEWGVKWVNCDSTDYPIFRVTDNVKKKYQVFAVGELVKVPFHVLWP